MRRRSWPSWPSWPSWTMLWLTLSIAALCVSASVGDQAPEFKSCVQSCALDVCGPDGVDDGVTGRPERHARKLPLTLRLSGWTCEEDCAYRCTHRLLNEAESRTRSIRAEVRAQLLAQQPDDDTNRWDPRNLSASRQIEDQLVATRLASLPLIQKQMVQYYGKWVFVRVWGIQEPLSTGFSVGNVLVQLYGLHILWSYVPDAYPLKQTYLIHALVCTNAWIWSAVFHTHDRPWAKKMDYCSAGLSVLHLAFLTIARFWRLSPRPTMSELAPPLPVSTLGPTRSQRYFHLLGFGCVVGYALHVCYLFLGKFDYGYNMAATIPVVMIHLGLLLLWAIRPSLFPHGYDAGLLTTTYAFPPHAPEEAMELTSHPESAYPAACTTAATPLSATPLARSSSAHRRPLDLEALLDRSSFPPSSPCSDSSNASSHLSHKPINVQSLSQRRRRAAYLVVGMLLASSLELWDFPPWKRALDAHALWHASTIPLSIVWYHWLLEDARALTLRAGAHDPSVRPTTPDPIQMRPAIPEEAWVATDLWASSTAHRAAHAPWWLSHSSPPYIRQGTLWIRRAYDHVRATCGVAWTVTEPVRQKGLVNSVVQGVDAVTDVLEASINRAESLATRT